MKSFLTSSATWETLAQSEKLWSLGLAPWLWSLHIRTPSAAAEVGRLPVVSSPPESAAGRPGRGRSAASPHRSPAHDKTPRAHHIFPPAHPTTSPPPHAQDPSNRDPQPPAYCR
jgi:hypothetical protein